MTRLELDSDTFENILGFLGPRDLVTVARLGQAFKMNAKEEVYGTGIMKWAQSTEKDEELMSFIRLAPNPRYLSDEPSNAQAFSFSSACKFAAASGDLEILKLLCERMTSRGPRRSPHSPLMEGTSKR